ncbi:hypothetical protein ACN38_g12500 [Penicillium nordicum]|uniref:Uncharacterized protein n=1 Tax=Penicillium nordicum TaxID=229535 RepID=A0A0M9W9T4_9EURO|nr:hypothetical protein ACN38_g12500 [Penicillium nordicum]
MVPKRLATCQRTRTRKPGLIWEWTCMGLNNVDVSCIGTRFATGPSTCTVSWGRLGAIIFSLSQLSSVIVLIVFVLLVSMTF